MKGTHLIISLDVVCDAGNIQYTYQNGHTTPISYNTPCAHDIPTHNLPDLPDSEYASVCTIGSIHDRLTLIGMSNMNNS